MLQEVELFNEKQAGRKKPKHLPQKATLQQP